MPPVTRRQTRSQTAGSSVGVPSSDPISASPERRNRKAAIAVDSSPSPKKSRKLPLRKKDGSPALRGQSAEQSDQGRPIEKNESVVEDTTVVAGTDDESAGSFEFGGEEDIPPAKKEVQEPKELKEREKASLREAASKTTTTTQTALPKAKAIRIVFDDDGRDPAADTTATTAQQSAEDHALKAPPIVAAGKDEADEDDEDAAPETVTSRRVDLQAEKSARAAIKAAQEQEASKKRKRDRLFKEQAEARKKRIQQSRPDGAVSDRLPPDKVKATKSRHGKLIVPDVLPAELLTDSESDGDGTGSSVRKSASATRQPEGAARPSKITFPEAARKMGREDRAPADERVGSTIFKVVKNLDDPRIPPKKKKSSLSIRMSLLARKRMPQAQNRGFFGKRN